MWQHCSTSYWVQYREDLGSWRKNKGCLTESGKCVNYGVTVEEFAASSASLAFPPSRFVWSTTDPITADATTMSVCKTAAWRDLLTMAGDSFIFNMTVYHQHLRKQKKKTLTKFETAIIPYLTNQIELTKFVAPICILTSLNATCPTCPVSSQWTHTHTVHRY